MEAKKLNRISKARVENYDKYSWFCDDNFAKWILSMLEHFNINSICDIGTGTGFMLTYYQEKYNPIYAIEPNEFMIEKIRNRHVDGISLRQCYAEEIDFNSNIVDISISKSSLHHFYDIDKALYEMTRISKKYIAIIEVIAAHEECVSFLKSVLTKKEPNRDENTVFLKKDIMNLVKKIPYKDIKTFRYDQVFDIDIWLNYGDISEDIQAEIKGMYLSASKKLKNLMGICEDVNHKLIGKRRMLLTVVEL